MQAYSLKGIQVYAIISLTWFNFMQAKAFHPLRNFGFLTYDHQLINGMYKQVSISNQFICRIQLKISENSQ